MSHNCTLLQLMSILSYVNAV